MAENRPPDPGIETPEELAAVRRAALAALDRAFASGDLLRDGDLFRAGWVAGRDWARQQKG